MSLQNVTNAEHLNLLTTPVDMGDLSIWNMTPLYEKPRWKRFIYKHLGWPKSFKPTGYKPVGLLIDMSSIKPIMIDGTIGRWEIQLPYCEVAKLADAPPCLGGAGKETESV